MQTAEREIAVEEKKETEERRPQSHKVNQIWNEDVGAAVEIGERTSHRDKVYNDNFA